MRKYYGVVQNSYTGKAIEGASITVSQNGVDSTIYSDDGSTETDNPLTSDENGRYSFYVTDGAYTLTTTYRGQTVTETDVQIVDEAVSANPLLGDNGTVINADIIRLSTAGGGTIAINVPGTYLFTTRIALKSYVSIVTGPGVWLTWDGADAAGAPLIESSVTDVLRGHNSRINIDSQGYQGEVVRLHSAYKNEFDIWHRGYSVINTVLYTSADSTAGGDGYSKRNFALNRMTLQSEATCGTLHATSGLTVNTYDGTASVVTLNDFANFSGHDQFVKGIDLRSWTDNNSFSGFTRVGGSSANNYIGVDFGVTGGTPAAGVYNNVFDNLGVDTFSTFTGRVGVRLRSQTKGNEIRMLHQDPEAEGGAVVVDADCLSYKVTRAKGSTGVFITEGRNMQNSGWVTMADDTAISINLGGGASLPRTGHIRVSGNDIIANGLFRVSVGSVLACNLIWRGDATFTVYDTGSALTGTTGTDNRFTIRAASDGKVYAENRLGYAVNVSLSADGVTGS